LQIFVPGMSLMGLTEGKGRFAVAAGEGNTNACEIGIFVHVDG
jgi:hypothetical protein